MSQTNGNPPLFTADIWINRLTVGGLVAAVLLCLASASVLAFWGKEVPQMMVSLAGTAIGALASLAVSPRRRSDQRNGH